MKFIFFFDHNNKAQTLYGNFDLLFLIQFILIKRIRRKECMHGDTNRLLRENKACNISDRLCIRAWIVIIFCMIYFFFISCMTIILVSHLKQANSQFIGSWTIKKKYLINSVVSLNNYLISSLKFILKDLLTSLSYFLSIFILN